MPDSEDPKRGFRDLAHFSREVYLQHRAEDADSLRVGDRMRFSTELLQQIHDGGEHQSEVVIVDSIQRYADGLMMVYLSRPLSQEDIERERRILHGDPDAPKPHAVIDASGLREIPAKETTP